MHSNLQPVHQTQIACSLIDDDIFCPRLRNLEHTDLSVVWVSFVPQQGIVRLFSSVSWTKPLPAGTINNLSVRYGQPNYQGIWSADCDWTRPILRVGIIVWFSECQVVKILHTKICVWMYKSADWDEMRRFFASYGWRQIVLARNILRFVLMLWRGYSVRQWNTSYYSRARCCSAKIRVDLELHVFKPKVKIPCAEKTRVQYCYYQQYCTLLLKVNWLNRTTVASLQPLLKPNETLAHTAKEKANLFANVFAECSRLERTGQIPPLLFWPLAKYLQSVDCDAIRHFAGSPCLVYEFG